MEWTNWAGSVRCEPARFVEPESEEALQRVVRQAARDGRTLRVVGSGHSFTPLVETDGVLVSLDRHTGVFNLDRKNLAASVRAGTKIHDLGEPLLAGGMALENQGDIDLQSLGGAFGTGTHGTGHELPNLSGQAEILRLVTADGEILICSAKSRPEIFRAARVSLGMLGVLSVAHLRLLPAYRLHERTWREDPETCLDRLADHVRENRHFEFFWYPGLDLCEMKTLNPTDAEPDPLPDLEGERIGWSCHIISSVRDLKFHEMEYSLPAEAGPECFREVRKRLREKHPDVVWPVEYRTVAADDADLSMAHGRPTVSISVHQDGRLPFREFFADIEPILRSHRGRPHWGKIHTCGARDLAHLYPRWNAFCALRQQLDPKGVFLNDHLRELFA